jgi:hypothetical protein
MAKQSALGANFYIGAYDLSGDVGAVTGISSPRGIFDVTAINTSAPERILGRRDGMLDFTGFWNPSASQIMPVLSAMPTTDVIASVTIPAASAFAVGDVGCAINGKQINFDPSHGDDGSLAVASQVMANGSALEWGQLLTAGKVTIGTGTVNGTSIDGAAATAFGLAAYLHVFSIASGTMGVKIQDSANDTDFDDISGAAFTNVTAATAERIVTSTTGDVRRYVRLVTTGTHGDASMVVLFVRYRSSQAV